MTKGYYNIQPVEVKIGATVATAVVASFSTVYQPFSTSMPFSYTLFSIEGSVLYTGQGRVDETLLSMWGEDDDYIINTMATLSGLAVIW